MGFSLYNMLGGKDLNQDFGSMSNFQSSEYNVNPNLLSSVGNLNNSAGQLGRLGNQFNQTSQSFLDPNSSMNQQMYGQLRNQIGDSTAQLGNQQNQAMASRGMGGGGMSNLLGAVNQSRAGEQIQQGMGSIYGQSLGAAQNYGNMALGAYGQQGSIYGQAGQLNAGIDSNQLQNNQMNSDNRNRYQQYLNMANYNQGVQNQNARSSFNNSMLSLVGGVGAAAMSGGVGAAAMSGINSDYYLKENIEFVDKSESGINIYDFDYKNKLYGEGRYRGVIAQEVPEASLKENGMLKVDYSKIDVNFERLS